MTKQSKLQKETVRRVMHEFKHGELRRGRGGKIKNPRQAIAIALSEAGASNRQTSEQNRQHLARTKAKERQGQTAQIVQKRGEPTRAELYRRAQQKGIQGRSYMSKEELQQALGSVPPAVSGTPC
jgi:hypothetical protein